MADIISRNNFHSGIGSRFLINTVTVADIWRKGIFAICLLVAAFMLSASLHAKDLPDFTDLVEKHGQAVVNISTVQTQQIDANHFFPGIPNIPEDSPFYEFFRRHMQPFPARENMNPVHWAQVSSSVRMVIF